MKKADITEAIEKAVSQISEAGIPCEAKLSGEMWQKYSGHIVLLGPVRRVDFWPSTGTVFSSKKGTKTLRGNGIERAIAIALTGK
jgi:hypothetical protein